jgi:hypothetical protein
LIDLQKDLKFNTYSTFAGKADWKLTRKHHLSFAAIPLTQSRQTVLNRTISSEGQTFDAGRTVKSQVDTILYAPAYAYDIIRRRARTPRDRRAGRPF